MRTNIKMILIVLMAMFTLVSCKKNIVPINLNVTSVQSLIAPVNNDSINLNPITGPNVVFQWSQASTPDSGLIQYEIAFDKIDGNFKNPIYKAASDNYGVQTQATISQKQLNTIASLAGINASSTGKLKWTVFATKVANAKISPMINTLIITRPAGFATLPDSLYITGSATEEGSNLSQAIPFKKLSDGVFELYTSLKAGEYQLTDKVNGNGTKYYIDSNIIKKGDSQATITGGTKVYRLDYDFNIASAKEVQIDSIGLYQSAKNQEIGELRYVGNSTWAIDSLAINFVQFSWGIDGRYKFVLHTSNGPEFYGSENSNNVDPGGQPPAYYYLMPVTNDQWDYTFKFDPSFNGKHADVEVFFQSTGAYTHEMTYLNY